MVSTLTRLGDGGIIFCVWLSTVEPKASEMLKLYIAWLARAMYIQSSVVVPPTYVRTCIKC